MQCHHDGHRGRLPPAPAHALQDAGAALAAACKADRLEHVHVVPEPSSGVVSARFVAAVLAGLYEPGARYKSRHNGRSHLSSLVLVLPPDAAAPHVAGTAAAAEERMRVAAHIGTAHARANLMTRCVHACAYAYAPGHVCCTYEAN